VATPTLPKIILGIDPGGTTGIAYWLRTQEPIPLSQWRWGWQQVPYCGTQDGLRQLVAYLDSIATYAVPFLGTPSVYVVDERFDFRHEERDRDKIDYTAAEVNGALRLWALDRPYVRLIPSGASSGKGFWDDDKIKKLGLWVPGRKHAMDATRHLLTYMSFALNMTELFMPLKPAD